MYSTELAYRRSAAADSNCLGVLIALYDTLAGDLRRAAEAQRNSNIETRSREIQHALLVMGHLETWVNNGTGGPLAQQLLAFYARLRVRLMEGEIKRSAEILLQQMASVLEIREYWQKQNEAETSSLSAIMATSASQDGRRMAMQTENYQGGWSA